MEVREICLKSDGLELGGEVYVPPAKEVYPAVCLCHGIPATPYDPSDRGYAALAERFCRAGFVTLVFSGGATVRKG